MLVGVPGSGKSTWINSGIVGSGVYVASTDNIIEGLAQIAGKTYDEMFKSSIKYAEKTMYVNVMDAVKRDMTIIWDQTNLTFKSRAKKLIMIPDHYMKIAVLFPTPQEKELQRRLSSRSGKTIPEHVIASMTDTMEVPMLAEGFDEVRVADFMENV
jgi:predicted kinase